MKKKIGKDCIHYSENEFFIELNCVLEDGIKASFGDYKNLHVVNGELVIKDQICEEYYYDGADFIDKNYEIALRESEIEYSVNVELTIGENTRAYGYQLKSVAYSKHSGFIYGDFSKILKKYKTKH